MDWDVTDGKITIRKGGPQPGCVAIGIIVVAAACVAVGWLWYSGRIDIADLEYELPIAVGIALFGLAMLGAAANARKGNPEMIVTIDSEASAVGYRTGKNPEIAHPFADLKAFVIYEIVTEESRTTSVHSGSSSTRSKSVKKYTYLMYLLKIDGSIFWLYTTASKKDAVEHMELLLDRIKISCIDEANTGLERTVVNTYEAAPQAAASSTISNFTDIKDRGNGSIDISLRYERYGLKGSIAAAMLLGSILGCPIWLYVANSQVMPGWFLILPGLVLVTVVFAVFMRGRRYSLSCRPSEMDVHVRFWFPPFQWIFGKSVTIPASALRTVRVNRYEEGEFHLELGVDKAHQLPKGKKFAFNSGAIRRLPRKLLPDDQAHIGLWSITPLDKEDGPQVADLYRIEEIIQQNYGLESSDL